ncbi:hypothetical protein CKAH01_09647 [Colletotrichum kahawae]|uniref:Uncharacterized protein n=1 Tax=Colletotrichum kahawae TaxID=34407 RepID=A0AAE0CYH4_COLKA|nr:hypothetical protein CKAH01_09647 [Colletotrichum kahawae]
MLRRPCGSPSPAFAIYGDQPRIGFDASSNSLQLASLSHGEDSTSPAEPVIERFSAGSELAPTDGLLFKDGKPVSKKNR